MRRRALRAVATAARSLALGSIFVSAAISGMVLHADLPATRRLVASITNDALATLFMGKLAIGEVQELELGRTGHVRIKAVEVFDPEGRRVLHAKGIRARIDVAKLVRSLASGTVPEVSLDVADVDEADLTLDVDASGALGIARAFAARPGTTTQPAAPAAESSAGPAGAASESVRLAIPTARVAHARVHGNVVAPLLDADADDVRARVFIRDNRLDVELDELRATVRAPRAPGQAGDVHARATGGLTLRLSGGPREGEPASTSGGLAMHWNLDGDAAGIPLKAHLALDGDVLDASADVATAQPDVLGRAFPALPFTRPATLHAKVHGTLPSLAITARGQVGDSTVEAEGGIALRDDQPFHLDADLGSIDAAAFAGPKTDVSGHVHVEGALANGGPAGKLTVTTKPSTVAGQRAPAVAIEGTFDPRKVNATFRASEPGAAVSGKVELRIPEQALAFDVNGRSSDLRSLARAPGLVAGSAVVRATGTLDLARATIRARVTADGTGIERSPASAAAVHAEATVTGPVASPVIDVTAKAEQVRLTATSTEPTGEKKAPLTYPSATARARIVLSPTPTVRDVEVHVEGEGHGTAIDASASEVTVGPGGFVVRDGRITGLGGAPLELEVQTRNGALSIRARGENVDPQRLATMTGIKELRLLPEGSRARLDVDLKSDANRTDGHVDVSIAGAKDGSGALVHATFEKRHVTANARVAVGDVGWIEVQRAEIELPGGLSPSTIKRARGALDLRGEIDLARGAALFGGETIEQMTGTALISARLERGDADNLPTVYASVRTQNLDVTFDDEGKSTRVSGIDGAVHVGYDGATDQTEVSVLTWDAKGILGSADAKARVPLVGWATGAVQLDRPALAALEVAGVVDVPPREVADLPGALARPDLRGSVSARASVGGSLERPHVTLVARADDLKERTRARAGARFAPIDGSLEARWDGSDVVAALRLDENDRPERAQPDDAPAARTIKRKSGHVRGLVLGRLPLADLLAGRPLAWNASGELDVADLELAPLGLARNLRGAITGRVKLRDLAGSPLLEARAHVTDLGFGGVRVERGDLKVEAKDGALSAHARVRQADGGSGDVKLVSSALRWHATDVAWEDAQPTRLEYKVDRMGLAILRPFVRTIIPEIDGRVDGRGSIVIDSRSQVFEGGIALSGGRFYVNALGEEVTDVTAVANFERGGTFRVQDVHGKIGTGELKASASGRMKGLRFESADMVIVVPPKGGVPLSAQGATFAEATGEIRLSAKMSADRSALVVTVAVPRSQITLPDRGTQNLQSLDPDETIAIGIRQGDGTLKPEPLRRGAARRAEELAAAKAAAAAEGETSKPFAARLTVTLGEEVTLQGRGLELPLGGRTVVEIAEEIAITGQIALRSGGTIDVQGRKFVVDRGVVTFVEGGASDNPIVVAAAYWDAPDRTRIWVEFNGPLKTGKLTMRSEPPFSKNEIFSILLFGRADPNQARAGDARTNEATAMGSGLAASGLSRALGELDEDFDLEQDRTSANRIRTKLGYKLRRNLKVQLGYAAGFSAREPDTTYLFLEWQFVPKWSLIGTRGDRGTSIFDVLFQHRY
jgi:translocation and assembly module TamB